jgi:hypothetical protein
VDFYNKGTSIVRTAFSSRFKRHPRLPYDLEFVSVGPSSSDGHSADTSTLGNQGAKRVFQPQNTTFDHRLGPVHPVQFVQQVHLSRLFTRIPIARIVLGENRRNAATTLRSLGWTLSFECSTTPQHTSYSLVLSAFGSLLYNYTLRCTILPIPPLLGSFAFIAKAVHTRRLFSAVCLRNSVESFSARKQRASWA